MAQKYWLICSNPECEWAIEWPLDQDPHPTLACEDCTAPVRARCPSCDIPIRSRKAIACLQGHPLRGPLPDRRLTPLQLLGKVHTALHLRRPLTHQEQALESELDEVTAAFRTRFVDRART